jgi:hypothetical protein
MSTPWAKGETMFSVSDFKELRPGLFKLDGHHVYVGSENAVEPCEDCHGEGKVQDPRPGRKTRRQCSTCKGKGETSPLKNVALTVPRTTQTSAGFADDLETFVRRLNKDSSYLTQPTYIRIG